MASELEYLRKDRDRWIEAWRKAIGDAERMRRCHEAEKNALLAENAALKADLVVLRARREAMQIDLDEKTAERDAERNIAEDHGRSLIEMDARLFSLRAEFAAVWSERSEFAKRIDEADATLAQRTAERDEARRDWCYAVVIGHERAEERARLRGWDCFEEVKP
jgi:hypothetical protein